MQTFSLTVAKELGRVRLPNSFKQGPLAGCDFAVAVGKALRLNSWLAHDGARCGLSASRKIKAEILAEGAP